MLGDGLPRGPLSLQSEHGHCDMTVIEQTARGNRLASSPRTGAEGCRPAVGRLDVPPRRPVVRSPGDGRRRAKRPTADHSEIALASLSAIHPRRNRRIKSLSSLLERSRACSASDNGSFCAATTSAAASSAVM
jgi:hypothetical protein